MAERLSARASRVFAAANLASAIVLAIGVFAGLPSRWWLVDSGAAIVVALLAASGVGLALRKPWSERLAAIASIVVLALGLVLVATLAITASYLRGIYGPVGRGGALILTLVAALALPYLVVLPAVELSFLRKR
jgi:hypothetical protein